jgi:CheY-like chemotaxis protein
VSGKFRMDVRPTALAPVIEASVESVRPTAEAREIRLQLALDPRPGVVLGDPERLQQVLWNLLSNAIKFTPKGGQVQVSLERGSAHVDVAVSDDGLGIDAPLLPRLFERFWQADTGTSRRQGGLGLGLAIVRHIVELHGGTVSAESAGLGRGATFRVSLPLAASGAERTERAHERAGARDAAADLRGVGVLVVDDEPDSNEAVQAVLSRAGAEVRVAGSAAQALEILGRWRPDVLVSDIGMPIEDGYSLIARVRALRPEAAGRVPALALTAYARTEDRVRALEAGFQMHVAKPADPSELVAAVASLAGRHDS